MLAGSTQNTDNWETDLEAKDKNWKMAIESQDQTHVPLWTKNFILLASGNLLLGIAFYFLLPILPLYLTDTLHISNRLIGVLMALFTISALIIRPITGFWLDRFNRRRIYLGAFAVMVALFAVYPLATGIFSMVVLRLAHGGAWGMTTTSSSTIIADIVPARRRGEGIGFFGLSMTLAMSLGPLLGMSIVKNLNYPALFYSGLGIGLAGLAFASAVSYPRTVSQKRFRWSELLEPVTIPISLVQLLLNLPMLQCSANRSVLEIPDSSFCFSQ
jgi:MFS family permease